ncbi:OR46A protein, partial [Acromyrmex heyeri]
MSLLEFTFKILSSCGCWIPNSWMSPHRRLIYHVYTIFILLLINTFTLSQFLDIILIVDNSEDFMDNFYMLLAMIVSCFKMFSLLINRNNIAMLTNILINKPCKACDTVEIEIQHKYDKLIETNTLYYMILVELTCASTAVASLLTDYKKEKLTFRAWLPFDYSSTMLFNFTYFHQLISLTVGSVLHVACDGLICGLLLHICCQLEILSCRLKNIVHNTKVTIFDLNFRFARLMNEKFRLTIVIQFVVSTLVVCVILYQFTKSTASRAQYMQLMMYMGCMLSQIFFYCWYGNEVMLKSRQLINSIFEIEWFELNKQTKQSLLMIMRRSSRPIELTSAYVISMNLDSFMFILAFTFKILTICGCGRLDSWPTPYKRLVYHVYTIFVMLLIHTFMLSQLMDLIIIVDNSNDFTDNFYVLLAMIVSCCKMLALLMNRSNIEMLIKTLMRKPFRPVEPDEMKIQQKFEKLIQSNTLYYTILVETTCLSVAVTSLLTEFKKGNLTFRAWLPFDYSSSQLFPFVYAHQLISFTMGSVHHVACDSLICGFLVHICCQIEILEYRLRKSARDPNILRECVLQHNNIFKANTIHYAILVETTCVCITLTSLLTDFRRRTLTFRAWLPYDYSSPILFYITYAHQLISLIIGSVLHVACDGLICGLLVHICCQIKILESRLRRIAYEPGILSECILQHSRIFEINTRRFICLGTVTCLCVVLTSLSVNFRIRKLTYRAWLPFDYSSTLLFYLMYAHQLICLIAGGFLNIGCDTLICGLLVHICCQIEILTYRLKTIVSYSNVLRDCVYQHYHIFRLTIAIQFVTSTLVVCFSLYQLSTATTKAKYIEMILYISCMLTEIFFYCWYGNELKIKSHQMIDNIFEMEWLTLDKSKKKSLIIIMRRTIVPIQITCAYIIPMNLDSFMGVIFMIILLYTFLISQFLDIIWNVDNAEDFTENLYATMASVVSCSKMLSLLVNRKNINMLINVFIEKPYRPLEMDEMRIRYKFDRLIYINTLYYVILVETTCACITVTSLFTMFRKGNLTYRAWLPYDYYSSNIIFCLTYAHQLISLTAGSLVNVACDSLICGLLMHICCQIEILECRLSKVSNDDGTLRDCVRHHDSILQYAFRLNNKFRMTIAMQFVVSTLVVCSNLYQMTKSTSLNASYLPLILYMSCMLTQIFIYCWYGNEVKLKSIQLLDNVFAMDWMTMNRNLKRNLLIIMSRAAVPIEFTSAYVLSMNLDSFVGLLKTSYSAYNILKQV